MKLPLKSLASDALAASIKCLSVILVMRGHQLGPHLVAGAAGFDLARRCWREAFPPETNPKSNPGP